MGKAFPAIVSICVFVRDSCVCWTVRSPGTAFSSREQACKAIGLYIEGFYNPRRWHSSLGDKSPAAFETAFQAKARTEQMALH